MIITEQKIHGRCYLNITRAHEHKHQIFLKAYPPRQDLRKGKTKLNRAKPRTPIASRAY